MASIIIDFTVGLLVASVMAIFGWAWTISNRVTVLETDKIGLKELMLSKFEEVSRRLTELGRQIEKKFEGEDN
jgi:hypothetical protein